MLSKKKRRLIIHGVLWGLFLSALLMYLNVEGATRLPIFLCAGLVMLWTALDVSLSTIKTVGRYRGVSGDPLARSEFQPDVGPSDRFEVE